MEVSGSEDRKVEKNASPSDSTNANRRGRPVVAGESLHPHGRQHQVDFERSRGYRRGAVASRHIWALPLSLADSSRIVTAAEPTQQEVLWAVYQN